MQEQIMNPFGYDTKKWNHVSQNARPFTSFEPKDPKDAEYWTLTKGMFKEIWEPTAKETYGHYTLTTATGKLKAIDTTTNQSTLIDPVAFAYDFGARMYDARIGRFLSIDPSQNKYPQFSPYSAFENNPIYFNDPDGKDARYAIVGNTITISSQIYISGNKATAAKAAEMQKQIMNVWNKDFKYTDANGKVYNVKFDVKVAVIDATSKEQQENFQKGSANIVSLVPNPKEGFRDYVLDGNTGIWDANSGSNTIAHETGHMFGLEDTYHDIYTPIDGLSNPTDEYGYNVSSVDYSTTNPTDIMGKGSRTPKAKVQQSAINAIANYALTNSSNVTQSNGTVTGTMDAGKLKLGGASDEVKATESQPKPSVIPSNKKN